MEGSSLRLGRGSLVKKKKPEEIRQKRARKFSLKVLLARTAGGMQCGNPWFLRPTLPSHLLSITCSCLPSCTQQIPTGLALILHKESNWNPECLYFFHANELTWAGLVL